MVEGCSDEIGGFMGLLVVLPGEREGYVALGVVLVEGEVDEDEYQHGLMDLIL